MKCSECGGLEWKTVKQPVHREYRECKSCGHAPIFDKCKVQNEVDFKEWLVEVVREAQQAEEDYRSTLEAVGDKKGILETAKIRKAEREVTRTAAVLDIGNALTTILSAPAETGMVTVHIPELGIFRQFTFGTYDPFVEFKKTLQSKKP